jgi:hypothetical protein
VTAGAEQASSRTFWIAVAAGAGVLFALAVLVYLAVHDHEFVSTAGHRPSYDPKAILVERVRVFDTAEFNIAAEAERPRGDLVTSYLLLATAAVAMLASFLAAARPQGGRTKWLFLWAALGTGYLAMDEQFEIHETLGANMVFLGDVPGIRRPDDVIFAAYAIPLVAFIIAFRAELRSPRFGVLLLGAAVACFGLAALADIRDLRFEDEIEALAALLFLVTLVVLALDHLGRDPRRATPAATQPP